MPIDIISYVEEFTKSGYEEKNNPLKETRDFNHPGWTEIREEMSWHVLGSFPWHIFRTKRPSEDPEIFTWRKKVFRPVTKGPMRDVMKDTRRIMAESNFAVRDIDEGTMEYVREEIFSGQEGADPVDFFDYMFSRAFNEMILDPHSCIVPMPYGEGLFNPSVQVEVDLWTIESTQIVERRSDRFTWKSYDKSRLKKDGEVYYVIDDTNYYLIEEKAQASSSDERFQITIYYAHNSGSHLAQILGGWAEFRTGRILYRSWFEGFTPMGNEALDTFSTYQVVKDRVGFPIRIQKEQPCGHRTSEYECQAGYLEYYDTSVTHERTMCPSCSGSGYAPPFFPGNVILKAATDPGETETASIEILEAPVESLTAMREDFEMNLNKADEALNKRFIAQAQSGKAKENDNEGRAAMIMTIAQHFFGTVIENVLYAIVKLRRPFDFQSFKPVVVVPTEFKLKDSAMLLEELGIIATAGLPASIWTQKVLEYCDREYGNDLNTKMKIQIALLYDPFSIQGLIGQNQLKAIGAMNVEQAQRSALVFNTIELIVQEMGTAVLSRDFTFWKAELDKRIDEALPEPEPMFAEFGTTEPPEGGE